MKYEILDQRHANLVTAFSCVETDEMLTNLQSKYKRRVRNHSKEMDDFLKNEALQEQELQTSKTHLLLDDDGKNIIAYISLCADSIKLEFDEREEENIPYSTAPAIKIARLAVSVQHRGEGFGRELIEYAAYIATNVSESCGVVFLTLDCYEHRKDFYLHMGFKENIVQPNTRKYDSPISMRINLIDLQERIAEHNTKKPLE